MRRREFITLAGGAAAYWPLAAGAQQPAMPIIGFLNSSSADEYAPFLAAFRSGLNEAGFIEGRNVAIEYRWADARYDRLPALAAELVRVPVAALVATGIPPRLRPRPRPRRFRSFSTRAATRSGLALSRASTGREEMSPALPPWAKNSSQSGLSCCVRWFPKLTRSRFLVNPDNAVAELDTSDAQAAAATLGQKLIVLKASSKDDIDTAFSTLVEQRGGGLCSRSIRSCKADAINSWRWRLATHFPPSMSGAISPPRAA